MRKRELRQLCIGFRAESLANGNILVTPAYRGGQAGVLTRLALACHVAQVLNGISLACALASAAVRHS